MQTRARSERPSHRAKRSQSAFEFLLLVTGGVLFVILTVAAVRTAILTNQNAANNTAGGYQDYLLAQRTKYTGDAVRASCVGGWAFEEGSGTTTADASGNGYTAYFYPGYYPTWTTGRSGYGLSFNGSTGLNAQSNTSLQLANVTVTARVKTAGNPAGFKSIVSKPLTYTFHLDGAVSECPNVPSVYDWSVGSIKCSTASSIADNNWHMVAVTILSGMPNATVFYVDGVAQGSVNSTATDVINHNVSIGYSPGIPANSVNGTLDEVAIYNRTLTASEIAAMYSSDEFWCD